MTFGVRRDLYKAIMSKHIGWHDNKNHSSGNMTAILASEVQLLNGAGSEALVVMAESTGAILLGLAFGFYFSWQMTVCCLAIVPLLMISTVITTKANKAKYFEDSDEKMVN